MKKRKLLMLLILSIFFGTVSVWAMEEENVWKPDEAFFLEHEEECIVENREYSANGPNGKVIIYESPASSKVVNMLENGEIVLIDYIFTNENGITWGFCELAGKFGWLPMPYMVTVYDYLNFEEEYGDQFQTEKGALTDGPPGLDDEQKRKFHWEFLDSNCHVKFWTYPGSSSKYTLVFAKGTSSMANYSKTFVDEEGRTWGFVGYFSGKNVNRWVCLESVEEMIADFDELYPEGAPKRDTRVIEPYEGEEIFPDDYEYVQKMQKAKKVAVSVGIVVVAGMAILFYWKMWKKMKQA